MDAASRLRSTCGARQIARQRYGLAASGRVALVAAQERRSRGGTNVE
jgi:hypothetical protein